MSTTLCKIILKSKTISAKLELREIDFDKWIQSSPGPQGLREET